MTEPARVLDLQAARARREARVNERWVSKRQVAAHFGVSVRTVENWMRAGLPHVKRFEHGHVKFKLSVCDEWFQGRAS